MQVARWTLRNH